jgi:nitrite reductase/ring-hydroxylating ferredoxin subunit
MRAQAPFSIFQHADNDERQREIHHCRNDEQFIGRESARHDDPRHAGQVQAGARITCPWHAWSYNLEGQLTATPNLGGMEINDNVAFKRSNLGLKPVRCEIWQDIVFVNLNGNAPPLRDYLAAFMGAITDYDLSGLRRGCSLSSTYPANWKFFVEGALEDYHVPWGHPEVMEGIVSHDSVCRSDRKTFVSIRAKQIYKEAAVPRSLANQELPEALVDAAFSTLPHATRLPVG